MPPDTRYPLPKKHMERRWDPHNTNIQDDCGPVKWEQVQYRKKTKEN